MHNIFFKNSLPWTILALALIFAATIISSSEAGGLLSTSRETATTTTTPEPPPPVDPADARLTTPQLLTKYGFPVEIHNVTTSDGYILTHHRISRPGAFPFFLAHGILCSSRDWLMQRDLYGLAYELYNAGYDVWLGNMRGTNYSRGHVNSGNANFSEYAYWDFGVDQIALIDVPANIDYVLNATAKAQLGWVGYSLGTTQVIAGLIAKPEYQAKVKVFAGLAPVTVTTHCSSQVSRLLAGLTVPEEPLKTFLTSLDQGQFMPEMVNEAINFFLPSMCAPNVDRPDFCGDSLALVGGFNPKQVDNDMQPIIFGGFPSPISVKTLVQQLQGVTFGANHFRKNYFQLRSKNIAMYGTATPPDYDLTQFRVPTILFAGLNDALAAPEDVAVLVQKIQPNLVFFQNVTDPSWSHLDFIFGKQAKQLVYDILIPQLNIYAPPS